jgi:hypothetical protein
MSAIWSLTGGKRTWRLCSPTSEVDPKRTWTFRGGKQPSGFDMLAEVLVPK